MRVLEGKDDASFFRQDWRRDRVIVSVKNDDTRPKLLHIGFTKGGFKKVGERQRDRVTQDRDALRSAQQHLGDGRVDVAVTIDIEGSPERDRWIDWNQVAVVGPHRRDQESFANVNDREAILVSETDRDLSRRWSSRHVPRVATASIGIEGKAHVTDLAGRGGQREVVEGAIG